MTGPQTCGEKSKPLSPREREIVVLVGQGLASKAICERTSIAYGTLAELKRRARDKLGLASARDLAQYARTQGWC